MSNIYEVVQQVLLGRCPPGEGKEFIKQLLAKNVGSREYSRGSCAFRLCRSLERREYHDFAGHLRQFLLTNKCGLTLTEELAQKLKELAEEFRLFIHGSLEIKALTHYPQWMDGATQHLAELYDFPRRRQTSMGLGDGILYHMTGYTHYISREQKAIISASMCLPPGHTLLACLPTSGGKSLVGQMPAFFFTEGGTISGAVTEAGSSIVVVPTVALAIDQAQSAGKYFKNAISDEHRPAAYYGNVGEAEKKRIYSGLKNGTLPLLFISPEATLSAPFQRVLLEAARRGRLNSLIVDEAHIVVDWGRSFRPEFQFLSSFRRRLLEESHGRLKTVLLSATLTEWTSAIIRELFAEDGNLVEIRGDALRPEPMFWLDRSRSEEEREEKILNILPLLPRPIILYVTKPERARAWLSKIKDRGFSCAETFTGETTSGQREYILRRWGDNELDIIVATSAFGMGVDKPDIRTVIHCCLPESINRFYQEVGRGGRDGFPSISILSYVPLVDSDETFHLINSSVLTAENIASRWESMRARPVEWTCGDTFWADTDYKPPHLEDKITGQRNADFNEIALLFLVRKKYIDILDTRDGQNLRRQVLVRMSKLDVLQNQGALLEEIAPLRERDWDYISLELQVMKDLAANSKTCWANSFVQTYSLTTELCGGCPACRRKNLLPYNSWQSLRIWGQENLPVASCISGLLSTWLGCGKEVLLYHSDAEPLSMHDLIALAQGLLKDGARQLIIPEPAQEKWRQMLEELPGENTYYSIFALPEVLEENVRPLIAGPVALVYPAHEELCRQAYHWTQDYLRQQEGSQVIHIAPKSLQIDGKKLSEQVEGGCYSTDKLIEKGKIDNDWI
ncbi:ATP-dependent DNA helicase RecQ [Desulfocucumis palustris]|uniref:DNA 3'-5' helicase n=1 Tax=Desulfocucumis palustris TaxID=1898651 RepID=A0A2L2X706_9FIRM|nr:protein DpdF [Desulfocucumis palustris]GBF31838.1 ATP-dependent DNA helicase RecQ [Desulfocucumis palustris]